MALTALLLPRLRVTSVFGPVLAVVALAAVNTWFWDAKLFSELPQAFTVQTATLILMNGVIFWILVKLLPGIEVEGVLPALAAPVVFTMTTVLITPYLNSVDWQQTLATVQDFGQSAKEMVQTEESPAPGTE